jgi:hypothetical protein
MSHIKLFQSKEIRSHWDTEKEEWYFSVIDVIQALTGNDRPRKYWSDLKSKLKREGSEVSDKIGQLKMPATDGKSRVTDIADTGTLLRLIQSIASPRAEPFKLWLAQVGYERLEENEDPELTIDRALETYLAKGYTKEWINQRLQSIEVRKELTDEWETRGVKKGQRDNMTNLELVLNMLAEATTTEISKQTTPQNFEENKAVAQQGGTVAGNARRDIESRTGKKVLTSQNARQLRNPRNTRLPDE